MKALTAVLIGAATLFAVLPGLQAILTGAGVPTGRETQFGGVALLGGTIVLLLAYIVRSNIATWSGRKVGVAAFLGLGGGLTLLVLYTAMLGMSEVEYEDLRTTPPETVVLQFPFTSLVGGDLEKMILRANGPLEAIDRYGRRTIEEELKKGYLSGPLALTAGLLMAVYVLITTSLVFSLSVAGWKAAASDAGRGSKGARESTA